MTSHYPPRLVVNNDSPPVDYPVGIRFVPHVTVPADWPRSGPARHIVIGAMPAARAADASHSSLFHVSTIGGIAIAALCIIYFGAEFLR